MKNKIQDVFSQIHANEELKIKTQEYIFFQLNKKHKRKYLPYLASACLFLLMLGVSYLYYTPTSQISMDINPSIELEVNCFNRVIQTNAYNEDGEKLLENIQIKNKNYEDAVQQLLQQDIIVDLLSKEEWMIVTVSGENKQSNEILKQLESCTKEYRNIECSSMKNEEVQKAHELGLSFGKYKVYKEILEMNPMITIEDVKDKTMKELRKMLESDIPQHQHKYKHKQEN